MNPIIPPAMSSIVLQLFFYKDIQLNKELKPIEEKNKSARKNTRTNKIDTRTVNKFPDFFRMGTFIDSTHMKL